MEVVAAEKDVALNYALCCLFYREVENGNREEALAWFRVPKFVMDMSRLSETDDYLKKTKNEMRERMEDYIAQGSNWQLADIVSHDLSFIVIKKLKKVGRYIL